MSAVPSKLKNPYTRMLRVQSLYRVLFAGLIVFLACLSVGGIEHAHAEATVKLLPGTQQLPLGMYLDLFEDPESTLNIEMVSDPSYSDRFVPSTSNRPNFGVSASAVWARITLDARAAGDGEWLLVNNTGLMKHFDVYFPNDKGGYDCTRNGLGVPQSQKEIKFYEHVVPVLLTGNKPITLYMRLATETSLSVDVTLWRPVAYTTGSMTSLIMIGLFIGGLVILGFYHLLIFSVLRETYLLAFCLFLFFAGLYFTGMLGVLHAYLWPEAVWWANHSNLAFSGLMVFFGAWFFRLILDMAVRQPLLDRAITWIGRFGVVGAAVSLIHFRYTNGLMSALAIVALVLLVYASWRAWRDGQPTARYVLASWLPFAVTGVIFMLGILGFISLSPMVRHGFSLSFLIAGLLWALAMADRLRLVQEHQNQILETAVEERTEELSQTIGRLNRQIHETEIMQGALLDSERKLRLLMENTQDVIWAMDLVGRFTFISPSVETLLGYTPEELIGRRIEGVLTPESFRTAASMLQQTISESRNGSLRENAVTVELQHIHKDGYRPWVEVATILLSDDKGKLIAIQGVSRDVTERKMAEQERRLMEQKLQDNLRLESLSKMAGAIAHDFNNLLTGIIGNASLMRMSLAEGSDQIETLEDLEDAAKRAAELSKQMLAYSGRGSFVLIPTDLSSIVSNLEPVMREMTGPKIELTMDLSSGLPMVLSDGLQLRKVVLSLLNNAVEAIEKPFGKISLSMKLRYLEVGEWEEKPGDPEIKAGDYVELEIRDDGIGMDARTKSRMFDPFFSTKFTGRGLELAAVMGIVRGHHGGIEVESAPRQGTSVKVFFPVVAASESATVKHATKSRALVDQARGGKRTILVVDDEELLLRLAFKTLSRSGYRVLTAMNGKEAVDNVRRYGETISAIILDLTMPVMDGEQAIQEIQSIKADARIYLCSGYAQEDMAERFSERNLAGFIQKPYTPNDLLQCLSRDE